MKFLEAKTKTLFFFPNFCRGFGIGGGRGDTVRASDLYKWLSDIIIFDTVSWCEW